MGSGNCGPAKETATSIPRVQEGPSHMLTTSATSDTGDKAALTSALQQQHALPSWHRPQDSAVASTVAGGGLDSSSESSASCWEVPRESASWRKLALGSQTQSQNHLYAQYAHCPSDVHVLKCFLELAGLAEVDGPTVKLLLRMLRFLHRCGYSAEEDICSILAHASAYFADTYALCGYHMEGNEAGNVLGALVFVAHCYVQDETCPLHFWHRHFFWKYCSLVTLSTAVLRLLELRHYKLRLEDEDLSQRFKSLVHATRRHRTHPRLETGSPASC